MAQIVIIYLTSSGCSELQMGVSFLNIFEKRSKLRTHHLMLKCMKLFVESWHA